MQTLEKSDAHSLGELLRDQPISPKERVLAFLHRAPFVTIAVMVHVIIAATMGLVYVSTGGPSKSIVLTQHELRGKDEMPKIEEQPPEIARITELPTMPEPSPADLVFDDTVVWVGTDAVVNPHATEATDFGLPECPLDGSPDFLTMGGSGKNLAGAIGPGSGSHLGGGGKNGKSTGGGHFCARRQGAILNTFTKAPIGGGLDWLFRHQSPDGSWDPSSFITLCDGKRGARCEGRGGSAHIAGLTGLSLLAFLGYGVDSRSPGPYGECVRKGLKWLDANQDAEGCFGPRSDSRYTYSHACATLAMCEGFAASKQSRWKKSAEEGLAFIAACQNPYKAWRYGKKPGDNDASVTGWMIMALKAGKDAGLTVSDSALKVGVDFINEMTDKETGRTGYTRPGELPVRPEGLAESFPANESEALTAVAMTSRIFAGTAQRDIDLMKKGEELLAKRLPVWQEKGGKIDMYYWYYGSLAMFQMGGSAWDRWNNAMKPAIIEHQHSEKDTCTFGSWDPKDCWAEDGGRIYSTALMTLCMEVYFRFPKVFGVKPH